MIVQVDGSEIASLVGFPRFPVFWEESLYQKDGILQVEAVKRLLDFRISRR